MKNTIMKINKHHKHNTTSSRFSNATLKFKGIDSKTFIAI